MSDLSVGASYGRLLAGIVRDFGVSHDAAASIVARAGHWQTTCDACGTRYVARYCGRSARAVRAEDVEARATRVVPMNDDDWSHIRAHRDYMRGPAPEPHGEESGT